MKKHVVALLSLFTVTASVPALEYNQTIIAISGSGIPDGGWTRLVNGDMTLGLRARNIDDNSTGNVDGYYGVSAGYSTVNSSLALWNYEFSISCNQESLDQFNFYLGIDADPTEVVRYKLSLIDPVGLYGNSVGTSGGLTFIQGSLNIVNYVELGIPSPDPDAAGIFDYRLFAVSKDIQNSPLPSAGGSDVPLNNTLVADVNIRVTVNKGNSVPDAGSTFSFLALAAAGLATFRRRVTA